ncbi:hypothetical protein DFH09DRAFT_1327070 [Mycena vulgaris]|nr:hypothetical protein DFH09DRAFT_1327070 [Mycena vulgaris]
MFLGWNILIYYDCAILFTGRPTAAADFAAGVVDGWPYPGHILSDTTMQIVGGKLYLVAAERHCAMACAYHQKLRKTIVFGGYHPSLSTDVLTPAHSLRARGQSHPVRAEVESGPRPWVPTYRCQAHIACDSVTGKTHMFGGWTISQFIPTRTKLFSRSFGDLWQLRMDVPGGHFEEVNVQEEARIARVGPWQRCFARAGAGPWKTCGGSCEDRAFFCGATCLREG